MSRLHPVFNVVKLTPAPVNLIKGHHPPPPLPEIIDREEEWVVEEVLDSKMMNQKLCYLVKWEGFGIEHNSWKPWECPGTGNRLPLETPSSTLSHQNCNLWLHPITPFFIFCCVKMPLSWRGVSVRGHPISPCIPDSSDLHSNISFNILPYIPPHCRFLE